MPLYQAIISSPVGKLGIAHTEHALTAIHFLENRTELISPTHKFTRQVIADLEKYFNNAKHLLKLPLELIGTAFQKSVWHEMLKIPCGDIQSYQALAVKLRSSPRAVGNACRKNPIAIIVPCHRVTAKYGIGGFAGATRGSPLTKKIWLLHHEGMSI